MSHKIFLLTLLPQWPSVAPGDSQPQDARDTGDGTLRRPHWFEKEKLLPQTCLRQGSESRTPMEEGPYLSF